MDRAASDATTSHMAPSGVAAPDLPCDRTKPFVFVSYAHADRELVFPELQRIFDHGWQVYYDDDIELGDDWNDALAEAVANCACFIVMLTTNALASAHVNHELRFAAIQGRRLLSIEIEDVDKPITLQWLLESQQQLLKWQVNDDTYEHRLSRFLDELPKEENEENDLDEEQDTLTVDPISGPFKKIASALAHAKPGDRVVVKPGVYKESLLIDKRIELVGEGSRSSIILMTKRSHVIAFRADGGRIANLTIEQHGAPKHYSSAVSIERGSPSLEECTLTSESGPCVAIGEDASPSLRGNTIRNGHSLGITVDGSSNATIEANEIAFNWAGIEVRNHGRAQVRGNQIYGDRGVKHNKRGAGILVHEQSNGTFEMNEICNYQSGFEVKGGSAPIVRRNEIHDNRVGIDLRDGGNGTYKGNRIYNHRASGIRVGGSSTGVFEGNQVRDSDEHGIEIADGGAGTFSSNIVRGNQKFGVHIGRGQGTFVSTELHGNKKGPSWIERQSVSRVKGLE
jgi:parallel beta-helix repeat protein